MASEGNSFHREVINLDNQKRGKKWKFFGIFIFVIFAVLFFYGIYFRYLSPAAKEERRLREGYEKYLEWEQNFEKAMREDTYGGKTPEETLALFIDALKKGDIELASKYIYQGTGVGSREYENRKLYIEALNQLKQEGKLQEFIDRLSKAEPNPYWDGEPYFTFTIRDIKDEEGLMPRITLFRHQFSTVWKIQSL